MKTLTFNNGDEMAQLGLGTWLSRPGEVYDAVRTAINIGYRHIDCASIYGNEKEIGQALNDAINSGDTNREYLWITSKLWNSSHRKDQVLPAIRKTLADLQLHYLDLYLVHWPVAFTPGTSMPESIDDYIPLSKIPLIETWKGMEDVKQSGLSRHIGVSNFSAKKISVLSQACSIKPEMNQVELHPFLQQGDLIQYSAEQNILITGYSPLGRPGSSGNEPSLFDHPLIIELSNNHECSAPQILIAWAIARGTSVIPKSVNPKRLKENFDALNVTLSAEDVARISKIDKNYRFVDGSFWTQESLGYSISSLWDE